MNYHVNYAKSIKIFFICSNPRYRFWPKMSNSAQMVQMTFSFRSLAIRSLFKNSHASFLFRSVEKSEVSVWTQRIAHHDIFLGDEVWHFVLILSHTKNYAKATNQNELQKYAFSILSLWCLAFGLQTEYSMPSTLFKALHY